MCYKFSAKLYFLLLFYIAGIKFTFSQVVYEKSFYSKASTNSIIGTNLVAYYLEGDINGATSMRFENDTILFPNKYPKESITIFGNRKFYPDSSVHHDRDLGQSFYNSTFNGFLKSISIKIGPNETKSNVHGAAFGIEWFEVSGEPKINENGTPGRIEYFDRVKSPQLDDFLEGENFKSIAVLTGTLPDSVHALDFITFYIKDSVKIELKKGKQYAFLLMFLEKKPNQSLTLYNKYYGNYIPFSSKPLMCHGLRREAFPFFETSWKKRIGKAPGTFGFPDVCTFRDYYFIIEGK